MGYNLVQLSLLTSSLKFRNSELITGLGTGVSIDLDCAILSSVIPEESCTGLLFGFSVSFNVFFDLFGEEFTYITRVED